MHRQSSNSPRAMVVSSPASPALPNAPAAVAGTGILVRHPLVAYFVLAYALSWLAASSPRSQTASARSYS
jgi:hypothetical protein